jgi:two-component system LytT family response regulator
MNGVAPLRALIVDDEPLAREGIRVLLARDPEIEVVGECADGATAVRAVLEHEPDLLLLDVQMPEMDGFQVLRALPEEQLPVVIFITAYDHYALKAFEVHALDYLLKPFDDERFERALARAKAQRRREQIGELSRNLAALLGAYEAPDRVSGARTPGAAHTVSAAAASYLSRLVVKSGGRIVFLDVADVDWIEAADYYVRLHTGGKTHLLRESMAALEAKLDPARFARIHRSAIVNLDRVRELQPWFRGQHAVILKDGTRLTLSRGRRSRLEELLGHTF